MWHYDRAFHEPRSLHLITVLFHHPKCNFSMRVSSVNLTSNPQWFVHINVIFFFSFFVVKVAMSHLDSSSLILLMVTFWARRKVTMSFNMEHVQWIIFRRVMFTESCLLSWVRTYSCQLSDALGYLNMFPWSHIHWITVSIKHFAFITQSATLKKYHL